MAEAPGSASPRRDSKCEGPSSTTRETGASSTRRNAEAATRPEYT